MVTEDRTRRQINVVAGCLAALTVMVAAIAVLSPGSAHRAVSDGRPFSPTSVWNAPLATGAPVASDSAAYVAQLNSQVSHYGSWINTYQYSVPVYKVSDTQPTVPVTLDTSGGSAQQLAVDFRAGVPIPNGAKPASGTDQSMVVWQPGRDRLWEFWHAQQVGGAWHARWGGKLTDVSHSPGYYTTPPDWGGSASSLSLLGGLILPRELRSGAISHALALAIPHAAAGRFVFPAQRTDGNDPTPTAIPEGTRFRLAPNVNVAALRLPRLTQMMALAAQRYGIIVRDQAATVSFYGQDPVSTKTNPYYGRNGAFGGLDPAELLRSFPWRDLEVVAPSRTTS